jgi:putative flippase GtrA
VNTDSPKLRSPRSLRIAPAGRVLKWLAVGAASMVVNLMVLAGLVDFARWPVPIATLVVAAAGTLVRFLANDRFVFGHVRPTRARFVAYCIATSGSACIGYLSVNTLVWFGAHYLFSAIVVTACSVTFNLATNFLWVWRQAKSNPPGSKENRASPSGSCDA